MTHQPKPETFLISSAASVSPAVRNPGSVAEMLAILADRTSLERPLTDAELAAKYPEDETDEDAEWDDFAKTYLD